jgi:hypothetical protein
MFEHAPQVELGQDSIAARRERMLPELLREVRARRRRRRAVRVAGVAVVLALVAAAALVTFPIRPRTAQPQPREARVTAPTPQTDVSPGAEGSLTTLPQKPPLLASKPRERKPLIVTVGTAPGLADRWSSQSTSVRVVMVDDEQLLASLNEIGERYGLVRMGDAATLLPRRER